MSLIIVKYAQMNYPEGTAPEDASVYNSYTASQVNLAKKIYNDDERPLAEADLKKLQEINPGVDYGIVTLE